MDGKVVDDGGWNDPPYAYARLLPPSNRYRSFRVFEIGSYDWHIFPWIIFADPEKITLAEYTSIANCVEPNLAAIDAAFDKATPERRHRLASMIHLKYDMRFTYSDRTTLGMKWECPHGAFIKTEPPDGLDLCGPGDRPCLPIGLIENDATVLKLYKPPKDFYAQCLDASGRSLFDTLKPVTRQPNARD